MSALIVLDEMGRKHSVYSGDSLQLARSDASYAGELSAAQLPRLRDSLRPDDGAVQYRISGGMVKGRPVLRLEIAATLWLTCQQCLVEYPETLSLRSVLPVARNEDELARWEREDPLLDALVAETRLDLPALVEDEILLSLPTAPRHPEGRCESTPDVMPQA